MSITILRTTGVSLQRCLKLAENPTCPKIIKGISTATYAGNRILYGDNTMRTRFDCKKENISKNKTCNQMLNTQKNNFFSVNFILEF